MKTTLQKFSFLVILMISALSTIKAQSLNGGTITTSSMCAFDGVPAAEITNVSSASGGTLPYTYQWEAKIEYSNWANVINVGNGLNLSPGILIYTTTYRRKVTDGSGNTSYSNEIKVVKSYLQAGDIRTSNTLDAFAVGNSATIVGYYPQSGSGSYSISWEESSSINGPWLTISGENQNTYQTPIYNTVGVVYLRKKVVDNNCGNVAFSNILKLEILPTTPLTSKYWSTQYLCTFTGYQPSLFVGNVPQGGIPPYSYQWQQKLPSDANWQDISSATGKDYQSPVLSTTTMFRRRTSDAAGTVVYTNDQSIVVASSPGNPGSITLNVSNIAPNTPYVTALEITSASNYFASGYYVWQESQNGGAWNEILSYNYNSYYPAVAPTSNTCYKRSFREVCVGGTRDTWTNTVCYYPSLPLTAGSISLGSSTSQCVTPSSSVGTITGASATGGSTPYNYKWQIFADPDWTDIAGATGIDYNPGLINHDSRFRRVVTDANGTTLYSNEISITVKSLTALKGGIIDAPIVTCTNTAPGIINNILDACGGGGVTTYSWEISTAGGAWSSISGANQPTYNATAINADTRFRRKVADGCGTEVYSNTVEVLVYPSIEAGTITPATQTVCTNQLPELLGLTQNCHYTNGTVTYQWQKSLNANGPWTNINGATAPSLLPKISATSSYYRLVVKSTVCNAEAISNVSAVIVNNCTVRTTGGTDDGNLVASNLSGKGNIKIYPNPIAKGQVVFVNFDGEGAGSKATLRSTDGRMYICTIIAGNRGSLQVKLPNGVAQGTYILQVNNGKKQWVERIVIM